VQKSGARLFDESSQHDWPSPPQVPQPPSTVAEQLPAKVPPHAAPGVTHLPLAQQPPAEQLLFAQHGCPGPPHATNVPAEQTAFGFAPACPEATHLLDATSRHAPPAHFVAPGHTAVAATPQ
jgi:hypothetical protein